MVCGALSAVVIIVFVRRRVVGVRYGAVHGGVAVFVDSGMGSIRDSGGSAVQGAGKMASGALRGVGGVVCGTLAFVAFSST